MDLTLVPVPCPGCGGNGGATVAEGTDYEYATTAQTFRFVRCAGCGVVYLTPRPDGAALPVIYPPHYYAFTGSERGRGIVRRLRARWERRKVTAYAGWLRPGPRRVLDVGCGTGRLLELLASLQRPALTLHGIDLDPRAIAAARAAGFVAEVATIESYRTDRPFDLIVLQQVIEHVADPRAVLGRLQDLLAPGGVVILETPDLAGWDERIFRGRLWGGYHFPRHWTLFTRASLRAMAEGTGLDVLDQRSLMSLSFWSWSIHHRLLTWGAPGWLVRWCRPPNAVLLALTLPLEVLQLALGCPTSNQRLVARRP